MRYMIQRISFHFVCLVLLLTPGFILWSCPAQASKWEEKIDADVVLDITPDEPASSELEIALRATKLASKRWIQSYTKDDKYYYFIQVTNPYKGHLRLTRVKRTGLGVGLKAYMDLLYFGHATNLDCSVYNGKTYLWTGSNAASGSDTSRAITAFRFSKNRKLYGHGEVYYRIPKGKWGKYVTNVYPALNEKSTRLAVRFTMKGVQYYQVYKLTRGTKINKRKPLVQAVIPRTVGDFQGFDLYGTNTIYTIEGSPNAAFLSKYDKKRKFQPTIIRTWNLPTRQGTARTIYGAKALSFREPEGIKVDKGRKLQIMFVSFRLTNQSVNLYNVKY